MRRLVVLLLALLPGLVFLTRPTVRAADTLSPDTVKEKKDEGFVSIFDGKTLKGWKNLQAESGPRLRGSDRAAGPVRAKGREQAGEEAEHHRFPTGR
jgi:hypothetical protein